MSVICQRDIAKPYTIKEINSINCSNDFFIEVYDTQDISSKVYTEESIALYFIRKRITDIAVGEHESNIRQRALIIMPPSSYRELDVYGNDIANVVKIGFTKGFINNLPLQMEHDNGFSRFVFENQVLTIMGDGGISIDLSRKSCFYVEQIINDILNEDSFRSDGYTLYVKGQLLRLFAIIIREYKSTESAFSGDDSVHLHKSAILECIRYISTNYSRNLKIDDIARTFCFSRTSFCELFKKYTGKTYTKFMTDLRIEKAKKMLTDSKSSLTDITYTIGFNDLTDFSRTFKKITGMTPSVYRKIYSYN